MAVEDDDSPREWRCFHCDEVFTTRQAAEDHFGYDESEKPGCLQILTETEKAIVEDRRFWRSEALALRDREEHLEAQLAAESWQLRQFGKEVRSVEQACQVYREEKNLRLSTEAKLRELVMRLQDAGVPWQPLRDESRSDWEILTAGGRMPVVDGCSTDPSTTVYGYALSETEAREIADRVWADPVGSVQLIDWMGGGYAWLVLSEHVACSAQTG